MPPKPDDWVSPNYPMSKFGPNPTIDDLITIFDDRVDGWQLRIAEEMLTQIGDASTPDMKHCGYALISVVVSYFEMAGQLFKPVKNSPSPGRDFEAGFRDVYPKTPLQSSEIGRIYDGVRCGMYHSGYTKRGVFIDGTFPTSFAVEPDCVLLNPHLLIPELRANFASLIPRLRNTANTDMRLNFEQLYNVRVKP